MIDACKKIWCSLQIIPSRTNVWLGMDSWPLLRRRDRPVLVREAGDALADKVEDLPVGGAALIAGDVVQLVVELPVDVEAQMLVFSRFFASHTCSVLFVLKIR